MKVSTSALVVAASLVLVAGLAFSVRAYQTDEDKKPANSKTADKSTTKHSEGLKIDRETQQRIGIELQSLKSATARPEITLYGTLEADPSEEFAMRSPLAGLLVNIGDWPALGDEVATGSTIGVIRPRLTPLDQLTLNERLASTRADLAAEKAAAAATGAEADRLKQLNADGKNASDKAMQEAQANAAAAEARVRSAEASEHLIAAALQPQSNAGAVQLQVSKGGQVLEVAAQPGEAVEPGQLLLRFARFDRLLARLYVPPGQNVDTSVTHAVITLADHEEHGIPARRVAVASSIDPKFQGQVLLFRLAPSRTSLRPGQAVTARLSQPGKAQAGVLIPSGAILRFQGETWVYIETAPGVFVRRMIALQYPSGGGWLVTSGVEPGQQIVTSGAQLLLSEEMKSQLESDEE